MSSLRTPIVCVLVALLASVSFARSIPGAANEVMDPWFADPAAGWYIEGQTWSIADNPGNLPGGYFDPGRSPGDSALLRTIVDDYKGLWNPDYDMKEIDLSFFCHVVAGGYINVRFDWWDDPSIPMPPLDPAAGGPAPDGYSEWFSMTALDVPGDFSDGARYLVDGEEPGFFTPDGSESWLLMIHEIWDHQPRWVSIEIELGVSPNASAGGEALITGIDFEARCVPEPGTLGLLTFGAVALLRPGRMRPKH